ncbi:TIM barrel protein [Thalassotalea sp. G2M2-11]|uniref:sugar phosphate isomerase/epimerase family protein n=1 Tax=Thalassotalea sp. G2M2-11 TaxID=2787627 RepID=UPI0019D0FD2D|nr:TIM barrel protein [Thalassotalea sp. G2M2-11]
MNIYRTLTASLALIISVNTNAFTQTSHSTQIPKIGIQLWSVKDALKKDFNGTLKQLADLGFEGVEFAGFYGPYAEDPHALKQLLDQLKLIPSGAHVGIDALAENVIDKNLLFFKTLGIELVIIPWDERAWHDEKIPSLTEDLNRLALRLANYGMKIGFHNHQYEFSTYKQQTYWDYIAQQTTNDVVLQLDVGWVRYAGKDAKKYIERYGDRLLTSHYKIATKKQGRISPIIGDNGFAWDKLIKATINTGHTQWIILEQEEYPQGLTSLEAVAKTKQGFDKFFKSSLP